MPTKIIYGTYKDGGDIYKDAKGYYVIQWDVEKQKEYKKYLKNFKPTEEPYVWKIPESKAKPKLKAQNNKVSNKKEEKNKKAKANKK